MEIIRMFMEPQNIVWGIVNFVFYIAFFYYLLHSIKNKVNLMHASIILAVLASLIIVTCPIINRMIL